MTHTEPQVEERAAQPYAYVHSDDVYMDGFAVIADRIGEVFAWLDERGVAPAGPVFFQYDRITMPGPMHIRAGVPIVAPTEGDDRVRTDALPAGRWVTVWHHGHPDGLLEATRDLLAWAEQQGLEFDQWDAPDGHAWAGRTEWFHSNPAEVPDLADWDTELAFKLR